MIEFSPDFPETHSVGQASRELRVHLPLPGIKVLGLKMYPTTTWFKTHFSKDT